MSRRRARACRTLSLLLGAAVLALAATAVPTARPVECKVVPVRIDINSADEAQLCLLPEIGPATAQRIVASRRERGPFAGVSDLRRVKGIGPATLAALEPHAACSAGGP